jgi:hypothetical protein
MSARDAEAVAEFLLERVRARHGRRWDEGAARQPEVGHGTPALRVFATRRVRAIAEAPRRGLLAWARGQRPADLRHQILAPEEVLQHQARGRRCVSLLDDATALGHGDPRHPDGLSFALHDLCHLEKFVAPEHHRGQVGFFRSVARAMGCPALQELERAFDARWRADRDYVIADMNGSAVFLFSVLKMRMNMAVRRRLAAARGMPAPTRGPLDADERAAVQPALTTLCQALELPRDLDTAALSVSTRRDQPALAHRLLAHFEQGAASSPLPPSPCADAASAWGEGWGEGPRRPLGTPHPDPLPGGPGRGQTISLGASSCLPLGAGEVATAVGTTGG